MKSKVVVVDDNPAVLRRLVSLLEAEFDVVSTAENGQLALERIRRYKPDIVVLDLEMPLLNGIKVTRELKKLGPNPAVVICSVDQDPEIIEAAQEAGALGFVFKLQMHQDLIRAVKSAVRGESFISSPC
jgi:DNA-binding NarL/FixJ family response regulator